MTSFLFDLAFYVTVPFWLLMVVAPRWSVTQTVIGSPLIVLPGVVIWAVLAVPIFPEVWAAVTSPSLDVLRDLVADDRAIALLWTQILAWDLFLGRWVFLESRRLDMNPFAMGPLLVLLIMLSPLVLPVFLVLRANARRRVEQPA
ncbi:ABA4-like family protein [Actinokineospora guangxiensis]|uniref:ABA4-like family protein n=1 Tax=Actinokineospora guangxiensis TaxID=1490288 RepID=A0ABW0EY24_9PSEU